MARHLPSLMLVVAAVLCLSCGSDSGVSAGDTPDTQPDAATEVHPVDLSPEVPLDSVLLPETNDLPVDILADLHDALADVDDDTDAADADDTGDVDDAGDVNDAVDAKMPEAWNPFCDGCEEGQVICEGANEYRPCVLEEGCWGWGDKVSCGGEHFSCVCVLGGTAICTPEDGPCLCHPDCGDLQCGADGCGGSCGECEAPFFCKGGICAECDDGNDESWDGCTKGQVSEFVVNEYTEDDQAHPSVAVFDDGGFVITWDGVGPLDPEGVWARIFNADGSPAAGDIHVNDYVPGNQENSRVATLADGRFVVTWQGQGQEDDEGVYARLFTAAGEPYSGQYLANGGIAEEQTEPVVASITGYHAVIYTSFGQTGFNHDVFARIFDDSTGVAGEEFMVNVYTDNDQQMPAAAALADERFVFIWTSKPQDGSWHGIYGRIYASDGIPDGDEFLVNSITAGNQWAPWVASHDDGFVVVWDGSGEGDEQGIYGRRFDLDANPAEEQFLVNEWVDGDQWEAGVAAYPDGRFVVVWESWLEVISEGEVFVQPYLADGALDGTQWQANLETYDGQGDPSVAFLPDGGFIAVWYSFIQDGSERGIFAQRYDADYNKIIH